MMKPTTRAFFVVVLTAALAECHVITRDFDVALLPSQ